jgi:MSHA biogenesis protein MshN
VSLINRMLRDLESRQSSRAEISRQPVYEDLRPARGRPDVSRARVAGAVLAAVAIVAVGSYVWFEWSGTRAPIPPVRHEVAMAPVPAAPAPVETPAPMPAAGLAEPPSPPPVSKPVTPKAPAVRTAQAPAAQPAPKAKPSAVAAAPKHDDAAKMEKTVKPLTPAEQAEGYFREAAALVSRGRGLDAEPKLRAALAANPAHARARELLVGIQLQQGHTPAARALLEQGIETNPKHTAFTRLLARLHVDGGGDAQAIALLEKHAAAAGSDAEYQALLATLYQRAGRHGEAIQRYTLALALRPQEGRWWMGMGLSCEAEKKNEAAAEAYQRALGAALDPKLQAYVRGRLAAVKK